MQGVFLDISKAFDKSWHQGLTYKLWRNCISGNLLKLLESFQCNRKPHIVLNDLFSKWNDVNAGVPQGSILGSSLFQIYINNLPENLQSTPNLFPDDTYSFSVIEDPNSTTEHLCNDPRTLNRWAFYRRSHQSCSIIKGVLRNFAKFTGKHLCQSLFFNKVAGQISKNTFFIEHLRATALYSTRKLALILILLGKSKKSHLVIKKKILPVLQFISMILQIIKPPDKNIYN